MHYNNDLSDKITKIKVSIKNPYNEDEIFAIPYTSGAFGTPKTVKWLLNETKKRYQSLYKKKVKSLCFLEQVHVLKSVLTFLLVTKLMN